MNTPQAAAVLVVETGADGRQALGPLLPSADAPCLSCLLERRRASEQPLGTVHLIDVQPIEFERLRGSRLRHGQLSPDGRAERLLCGRALASACPLDVHAVRAPALEDAVGPRLGLISRVETSTWVHDQVTCIAIGSAAIGSAGVPLRASGTATAPDAALARRQALCEALEHHAAGFWPAEALVSVAPARASVYGTGPWVRVQTLGSGRPVWVPAARVYMPFPDGNGGFAGHSEGLACGVSCDDARQRAVAELLERRAVDRLWSRLAQGHANEVPDTWVADRVWEGVVARPLGQSVAVSLHAAVTGPPYGWAGFGCDVSDTLALAKARREAVHVLAHMRRCAAGMGVLAQATPSAMDQRVFALAFYPGHAQAWVARLGACASAVDEWDWPADCDDVAWRDITPPDIQRLGLSVVRAVSLDFKRG